HLRRPYLGRRSAEARGAAGRGMGLGEARVDRSRRELRARRPALRRVPSGELPARRCRAPESGVRRRDVGAPRDARPRSRGLVPIRRLRRSAAELPVIAARVVALVALVTALLVPCRAWAHPIGYSAFYTELEGSSVRVSFDLHLGTVADVLPDID